MADNDDEPTVIKYPVNASCRKGHQWAAHYWDMPATKESKAHRKVEPEKCPTCGLRFDVLEKRRVIR